MGYHVQGLPAVHSSPNYTIELFQISIETLEQDIMALKPKAVILGGGLWFVRDYLRDFDGYRTALKEELRRLMWVLRKVSYSGIQPC